MSTNASADTADTAQSGARLMRGSMLRGLHAAIAAVAGFLLLPFYVRYIGAEWYGVWAAVTSLLGVYYLLDFGLAAAVTRYMAHSLATDDHERANRIVSTALVVYSSIALLVLLVTVVAAVYVPHFLVPEADPGTVRELIILFGLSMAIGFPVKAFAGIIQARLRYDLLATLHITVLVLGSLGCALFVYLGYGVVVLAYAGLATTIISDLGFVLLATRTFKQLRINFALFDRGMVRELFSFSTWSFLITLSNMARFRVAPALVSILQTPAAVTHYVVGQRLAEISAEGFYQLTNTVQPLLTAFHARNERERLLSTVRFVAKLSTVLAVFVVGMLVILGKPFVARWMGPTFIDSVAVLYALVLANLVSFVVNPLENSLYSIMRHKFLALVNVGDAVLNIGLSILLGLKFGLVGVALGMLIPLAVGRLFLVIPYACKQLGLSLGSYLSSIAKPIAIGGVFMLGVAWVARNGYVPDSYVDLLLYGIVGATLYFGLMFVAVFSVQERTFILQALLGALGVKRRQNANA